MNANKPDIKPIWNDPDDAPELTDAWFEQADLYRDGKLVRHGRSADNDVLRDWLKSHSPA
ncbi:MAG: hypothetical protein HQL96_09110 [Magnetococcales bacterium]|nr:hypothetical protein [Magnetococcales bacterium]